jgi:hypothetical protein
MAKCSVCGRVIGPDEGFFGERSRPYIGGPLGDAEQLEVVTERVGDTAVATTYVYATYCEKCYANKRAKELPPDALAKWRADVRRIAALEVAAAPPEEKERVRARWKARLPSAWEGDVEAGEAAT